MIDAGHMSDSFDRGSRERDSRRHAADMTSTLDLLDRFKRGDQQAVDLLVERSIPPLTRWARGRLPSWARGLAETQDMVQNALLRALPHLKHFEAHHAGAFQAYLRQAVANHIRDEIRKASKRQTDPDALDAQVDPGPSPLERAVGREGIERYEAALAKLRPTDREAIIARVELQQSARRLFLSVSDSS
jgi:RNA polymerase sigma-70 factor, ECF subfamily